MKKFGYRLLCLTLAAAFIFAGCGNSGGSGNTVSSSAPSAANQPAQTAPGEKPKV